MRVPTGRVRARRLAAQAINDALDAGRKRALTELLKHDPSIGRSRLTWLRVLAHSTSAASMQGLLERPKHARALGLARDPFDVLDEAIGWDRLIASRDEIDALGDLATENPLSLATGRYVQLRRFAPAFLEAFEFDAPAAGRSLQAAVELLRELNRSGKRKLPDIVPMPFASRQWRSLVASNGKVVRRTYETAVVATLRDRLRAGNVWVEGSRDYRRFDAYLPPANEAEQVLAESGIETDATVWLASRREALHERLGEVGTKLARGGLERVRFENARLRITPHDAVTPPAGERLDRAIDALMPRTRITDLLWDVNSRTGFVDAFTDLRSGRVHSNRAAILAAVLAGATNLGLERMARASSGVSHAQLPWANAWHLRPETYADALARIIDAHHALPLAHVWGSTGRTVRLFVDTSVWSLALRRDARPR